MHCRGVKRVAWVPVLLLCVGGLWAQTPSDVQKTHDVKVNIQTVFTLNISQVNDYQHPNGAQADNGNGAVDFFTRVPSSTPYILAEADGEYAVDLVVESNYTGTWYLKVKGIGDFNNGSSTFPLSRLSWRKDGTSSFTSMTTSYATVTSGTATSPQHISMDYQLEVDWTDPPGEDYSTTITYLLTTTP